MQEGSSIRDILPHTLDDIGLTENNYKIYCPNILIKGLNIRDEGVKFYSFLSRRPRASSSPGPFVILTKGPGDDVGARPNFVKLKFEVSENTSLPV